MRKEIKINKEDLAELYISKKMSTYGIAKIYNCSPNTVQKNLKKFNIERRRPGESDPRNDISKEALIHYYINEKKSSEEVAKIFNCSATTIRNKLSKFNIEKRSVQESNSCEMSIKKREKTNLRKYGVKAPIQNVEILKKTQNTNLKRHGNINPMKNKNIAKKANKKRIESLRSNGKILQIKNKTIPEISKKIGISDCYGYRLYKKNPEVLTGFKKNKNSIESLIENALNKTNIDFSFDKKLKSRRYDFLIPDHKLVIECDGLYWHSDLVKENKSYHKDKLEHYENLGYKALFFREDEILNKTHICESIILNKIGKSKRIFARKCKISTETKPNFFERNHLMGKGSGRIYSLVCGSETVAAIQVKWKSKKTKSLEISRFCTKNEVSVIGGFSKLLRYVEKTEKPNEVITFIDRRYGQGVYLKSLRFELKGDNLSFLWTNGSETFHRMKFPGNSGYDYGLAKIWDCGQAKWVKKL